MLLYKTSQYSIQVLIYISLQEDGLPVLAKDAAEQLQVSPTYLAKILQTLAKAGLVKSRRGRKGGFQLTESANLSTLMEIVEVIEGQSFSQTCLLGLKKCSDETACPVHNDWMPVKDEILQMLNQQTLDDLSAAVRTGHYRICLTGNCPACQPTTPEITQYLTGQA